MERKSFYIITADYRPKNPNKPTYLVRAENKREAKKRFEETYSWLKVYHVEETNKKYAEKDAILLDKC